MPFAVRSVPGGVQFAVRVQPGAKRQGVTGVYDDPLHGSAVRIALEAPATDGRANDALIDFLASRLGVPKRSITLVSGAASRLKVVRVLGTAESQALALAAPLAC